MPIPQPLHTFFFLLVTQKGHHVYKHKHTFLYFHKILFSESAVSHLLLTLEDWDLGERGWLPGPGLFMLTHFPWREQA